MDNVVQIKKADGILTVKPSAFLLPTSDPLPKNLWCHFSFPATTQIWWSKFQGKTMYKHVLWDSFLSYSFSTSNLSLKEKTKFCSFKNKIYFIVSEGIVDDYLVWYVLGGVNHIIPVNDKKWVSSSKCTNLKTLWMSQIYMYMVFSKNILLGDINNFAHICDSL